MEPKIDILLATYNGEKYIEQQIESIIEQSYQNFKLIIRDDNSSDDTVKIIYKLQKKYSDKIQIYQSPNQRRGLIANFSELLSISNERYLMLSDQDDIWIPHKVEMLIHEILSVERENSISTPTLIHTDLIVVDEDLKKISNSYWRWAGLNPNIGSVFSRLLVQNVVTGCTTIFNRPLADLCYPISEKALMHDWWIALVVSAFGIIRFIPNKTVMYRQHRANVVGARKWSIANVILKTIHLFREKSILDTYLEQAQIFNRVYGDKLQSDIREILNDFLSIKHQNKFLRRLTLLRHNFLKGDVIRNIGLLIKV